MNITEGLGYLCFSILAIGLVFGSLYGAYLRGYEKGFDSAYRLLRGEEAEL